MVSNVSDDYMGKGNASSEHSTKFTVPMNLVYFFGSFCFTRLQLNMGKVYYLITNSQ